MQADSLQNQENYLSYQLYLPVLTLGAVAD